MSSMLRASGVMWGSVTFLLYHSCAHLAVGVDVAQCRMAKAAVVFRASFTRRVMFSDQGQSLEPEDQESQIYP